MRFRYTLSHERYGSQVVEDPVGWDELELELSRDMETHGVFSVFARNSAEFWGQGKAFLDTCFQSNYVGEPRWSETQVSCHIEIDDGNGWETVIQGVVAFDDIKNDNVTFSVNIEEAGIRQKLVSREKTKVNIRNSESIEGVSLPSLSATTVGMESINLYELNSASFSANQNTDGPVPLNEREDESVIFDQANNRFTCDTVEKEGDWIVIVEGVSVVQSFASIPFLASFFLQKNGVNLNEIEDNLIQPSNLYGNDFSMAVSVTMNQGDFLELNLTDTNNFDYLLSGSFYVLVPTKEQSSSCKASLIHEALYGVLRQITDNPDPLRSPIFGRTDSTPYSYGTDGKYAHYVLFNGFEARGIPGRGMDISLKKLFSSLDRIFFLGMGIDGDGRVVIDGREQFYDDSVFYEFLCVDWTRDTNPDLLFTEVNAGYKDYYAEDELNSNDAVHGERGYATPISSTDGEYDIVCQDLVADPYTVETARRARFERNGRSNSRYDKKNFIMEVKRELAFPPFSTYQLEDSGGVDLIGDDLSLFDILSYYNFRITPARNAHRHRRWWQSSLRGGQKLRLVSSEGNDRPLILVRDSQNDASTVVVDEDGDLSEAVTDPILDPFILKAEVPFDHRLFRLFATPENRKKLYGVGRGDKAEAYGFIKSIGFTAGSRMATIRLLEKGTPLDGGLPPS